MTRRLTGFLAPAFPIPWHIENLKLTIQAEYDFDPAGDATKPAFLEGADEAHLQMALAVAPEGVEAGVLFGAMGIHFPKDESPWCHYYLNFLSGADRPEPEELDEARWGAAVEWWSEQLGDHELDVSAIWHYPTELGKPIVPLPIDLGPGLPLIRGVRLARQTPDDEQEDRHSVILNEFGPMSTVQLWIRATSGFDELLLVNAVTAVVKATSRVLFFAEDK